MKTLKPQMARARGQVLAAKTWAPMPGFPACYTGNRSRGMRRNNRVQVFAETCGKRFIVQPLLNGLPCGLAVNVKAENIAPIQGDFFVRIRSFK